MNIVLPYIGSKKRILPLVSLNVPEHSRYIEPFAGGFSLGLNLIETGVVKKAVLNDLDSRVTDFWNFLKTDYWSLSVEIESLIDIYTEAVESGLDAKDALYSSLTSKLSESALFYLLKKMNRSLNTCSVNHRIYSGELDRTELFYQASMLLRDVEIRNNSFDELGELDGSDSFWYLDPPYYGYQNDRFYGGVCKESFDHEGLRDFCSGLRGKFILSYGEAEYIRNLYRDFHVMSIFVPSRISARGYSEEVLISNYPLTNLELLSSVKSEKNQQIFDFHNEFSNLTLEDISI